MTVATNNHIVIDDKGVARIGGTRFKVIHLVKSMMAWHPTVQQLHEAHPDLTLAQIHAALAYYYDHKAAIDAAIERETREFDEARAAAPETPARAKLRALKNRP